MAIVLLRLCEKFHEVSKVQYGHNEFIPIHIHEIN